MSEFQAFPKIPRLSRDCVITEKLDGTNASVFVFPRPEEGYPESTASLAEWDVAKVKAVAEISDVPTLILAGSRTRWLTSDNDNHGFARWVFNHADELVHLGPGHHFGEWWGQGINRGYGLSEKRFSLFNVERWGEGCPACCYVVPILYRGLFSTDVANAVLSQLAVSGSLAAPGFMQPEGVVIYHTAANQMFKKTLGDDDGKTKHVRKIKPYRPHENVAPRIMWTGGRRKSGAPYPAYAERRTPR